MGALSTVQGIHLLPGGDIWARASQLHNDLHQRHLRPALDDGKGPAGWKSVWIGLIANQVSLCRLLGRAQVHTASEKCMMQINLGHAAIALLMSNRQLKRKVQAANVSRTLRVIVLKRRFFSLFCRTADRTAAAVALISSGDSASRGCAKSAMPCQAVSHTRISAVRPFPQVRCHKRD